MYNNTLRKIRRIIYTYAPVGYIHRRIAACNEKIRLTSRFSEKERYYDELFDLLLACYRRCARTSSVNKHAELRALMDEICE